MPVVEITKARIIKAIEKEPVLRPNDWVDFDGLNTLAQVTKREKDPNYNCSRCAVGSVLCEVVSPTTTAYKFENVLQAAVLDAPVAIHPGGTSGYYYHGGTRTVSIKQINSLAKALLKEGKPLNALSVVFEGYCFRNNIDMYSSASEVNRARRPTINFVKKYFPNKIQIDIDGAKPAKDVKVVKTRGA